MDAIVKIFTTLGLTDYAIIALVLSIFIDVNPKIKFNPIKSVISYLGKWFNNSIQREISGFKEEVNQKLDDLQKEQNAQRDTLNKIIRDRDNSELSRLRWEVIDFENSINNGEKHTREQYRHILDDSRKYLRLLDTAEDISVNEEDVIKIKESTEFIRSHYEKNRSNQSQLFF